MSIIERIRQIIEYKNISARRFCTEIGVSNGFLDKVKDVGSDKVAKILNTYEDISTEWLVLGKGDMLRVNTAESPPKKVDETPSVLIMMDRIQELTIELHEAKQEIDRLRKEKKATKPHGYNIAAEPELKPLEQK